VEESTDAYDTEKDEDLVRDWDGTHRIALANYYTAGQSRRIWNELYKVSRGVVLAKNPGSGFIFRSEERKGAVNFCASQLSRNLPSLLQKPRSSRPPMDVGSPEM